MLIQFINIFKHKILEKQTNSYSHIKGTRADNNNFGTFNDNINIINDISHQLHTLGRLLKLIRYRLYNSDIP